jgi:uncharacterized membrane protein YfcA
LSSLLCIAVFLISVLYSCVGQAGATGYIAAMALLRLSPSEIKPTALVLNVLVSAIVTIRFRIDGRFRSEGQPSERILWPLTAASIPMSLLGGYLSLPTAFFNQILGVLLCVAALSLLVRRSTDSETIATPRISKVILVGAIVGLLSGLTGVGGGVLITPLLLRFRWVTARSAAAISGVFILINSLAALLGHISAVQSLPSGIGQLAIAAACGGLVGSQIGSAHLSEKAIHRVLGAVLFVAGFKLLFVR